MSNLELLEQKVQEMLEGEKKRRDIAYKFIDRVQEILLPVSEDLWGAGDGHNEFPTIALTKKDKEGKIRPTEFYFRYKRHVAENNVEEEGFYSMSDPLDYPVWGTPVQELKGRDFWYFMQILIGWVEILIENIDKRNKSRDELLALVNTAEAE